MNPAKVAEQAQNLSLPGRIALPALLANSADALHVFCYAAFPDLVRYAIMYLGESPSEAPKRVREVNHQRAEYVRRHFKRDWSDPANYDLCVNTARLGLDGAAELVTQVAKARFPVAFSL